jgi:regulator of protease activity HflC (stomatin/prohibitin superfamily)
MATSSLLMLLVPLFICGLVGLLFVVLLATSIKIVPESKRLSVFRMGQFIGEKGPGLVVLMPLIDKAISSEPGNPIRNL